ncbi:MAG: hypothetical protein M1570_14375 [Chloroflexi bacterium]|nr:hypothetical protein [Chloroflexota bacterium]
MKPIVSILIVATLGLGSLTPVARVDAATEPTPTRTAMPRSTPTIETGQIGDEESASPTPKPVVNFWLFYGSHCSDCVELVRDILPAILAQYDPDQVLVFKYDLEKGPSDMMRALEQWHGLAYGDVPEIFIGDYALLGNQKIQEKLAGLIDHYLAQGGVELLKPNLAAASSPTPTLGNAPSAQATPVVRAVLFWSATCPHCREVVDDVLPPLRQEYGSRLDIQMFELSDPANVPLFDAALDALRIPPDQQVVPLLVVGDTVLVGSLDIPQRLPGLVEKHLAAGGVGWPAIPGLENFVRARPAQTPPADSTRVDSADVVDTPLPPASVTGVSSKPVVRGLMFWMNGCPHCEEVIDRVLPPLQEKYGDQLDIRMVEVRTTQDVDQLYQTAARFGVPKDQTGVPFLIVGDQALVGSDQIPAELPALIEKYIAAGGVDLPATTGLIAKPVPTPASSSPICAATGPDCGTETAKDLPVQTMLRTDPAGFVLASVVMLGMLTALVRVALGMRHRGKKSIPAWMNAAVPILVVFGLGVAGYLAYVEVFEVSAICGPVGHCNAVQQSPYARLFGVLPIGVLGVVGYLAILGTWLIGQVRSDGLALRARRVAFVFAAFGVLFSLYLTFLEPFVIGAVCAWCLSSAVIMTALMVLLTHLERRSLSA